MALAAYRHLLRATRVAFEGDSRVLSAAREQIRSKFREKATLSSGDPQVRPAIQHAQEVASFLRANVVQGRKDESGLYKLKIHNDTERGDNDTIKVGNKTIKIDGKTCADG